MSDQDLSERQKMHRDEAFSRVYHRSWIPPLLICLTGIKSKICFSNLFCGFIIYEFSMLIYL